MPPFYATLQTLVTRNCASHLPYRVRERWCQLVYSVLVSGTVVLNRLAACQAYTLAKAASFSSLSRNLKRLGEDRRLNWSNLYAPLIKGLWKWQTQQPVILIMDETAHTERFRLLLVAVWYEGRALPLAWECWLGNRPLPQGETYWAKVASVLQRAATLIPTALKVVVVADRAYGHPAFTDLVHQHAWHWVVRLQAQTRFEEAGGWQGAVQEWVGQEGERRSGEGRLFKKAGWRQGRVVGLWEKGQQESLLLASDLEGWGAEEVVQIYRRRYGIEGLFRDYKRYGWQWESSQAQKLETCEWQVLALGFVTAIVLALGSERWEEKDEKKSMFYLGRLRLGGYLLGRLSQPPCWKIVAFSDPLEGKKRLRF